VVMTKDSTVAKRWRRKVRSARRSAQARQQPGREGGIVAGSGEDDPQFNTARFAESTMGSAGGSCIRTGYGCTMFVQDPLLSKVNLARFVTRTTAMSIKSAFQRGMHHLTTHS
jgi:hypothetical protein